MTVAPSQHRQEQPKSLPDTIRDYQPLIKQALPKHLDVDRFTRLALTTLRKTPQLQRTNPASFVGSLLTASALGLEPDVLGECYLVPYKGECTLIVGYQGLAKLFWQHPLAKRLSAEYVCENDHFDFSKGLDERLEHRPATGKRGKVVAYYAIVELQTGARWFDVFTPEQIAALRSGNRKGQIADPEHWMERKTALKQVLKMAPKSTSLAIAERVDERVGLTPEVAVQVANGTDPGDLPYIDGEVVDEQTGEVQPA